MKSEEKKMRSAENVENYLFNPQSTILDPALFNPQSTILDPALLDPQSFTQQLEASPLSCAGKTPAVSILDPALLSRIRWRCRRGLLELDIVLGRFVEARYARLSGSERQTFEQFLDMADNPLWDMISGRMSAASDEQAALLEKIRSV
jgi:antitoxin CptB